MTGQHLICRTIEFAEPNYLFGLGTLRLYVSKVYPGVEHHHGDVWVKVEGVEVGAGGRLLLDRPRQVLVRRSALSPRVNGRRPRLR